MQVLDKNNLQTFLDYYHYLHDSTISKINYDITNSQIELIINVFWVGKPVINKDQTYQNSSTKIRMIFNNIKRCNNIEINSWEYIDELYFKYIKLDEQEYLCFATDEKDPFIYIVCDSVSYEEI